MGMNIGLIINIIGMGIIFIYPTYAMFFIGLLLAYLGTNIFTPSLLAYIGDKVEFAKRGTSIALTEMSWSLSFIAFVPLAGVLIQRYEWSTPFFIICLLSILGLFMLQLFVPGNSLRDQNTSFDFKNIGKAILHKPALSVIIAGFAMIFGIGMLNLMFGVWLEDSFNIQITALGKASIVIGIAELTGASLSAIFADKLGKKRSIMASIILNILVVSIFPLFTSSYHLSLLWLFLFYIFAEYTIVSILALSTEVIPWARTTFIAIFTAALTLGMGLGSYIAPYIYINGFNQLTLICGGLLIIALLALYRTEIKE